MRYSTGKLIRHTKRRGGPLDTVHITTRCRDCQLEVTHPLRWFQRDQHTCAVCGGALDEKPLRDATIAEVEAVRRALKRNCGVAGVS